MVAGLTAFYSIRLIVITFLAQPNSSLNDYKGAHESSLPVIIPLVTLAIFAIGLGYISIDLYRGIGTDFISISCPINPNQVTSVDAEFASITAYKLIPFVATLSGTILGYITYINSVAQLNRILSNSIMISVYRFFNNQWNFDSWIINNFIVSGLGLGYGISKLIDRGILESIGPYGFQTSFVKAANSVVTYNTAIITDYAIYIVLGMLSVTILVTVLPAIGLIVPSYSYLLIIINIMSLALISTSSKVG